MSAEKQRLWNMKQTFMSDMYVNKNSRVISSYKHIIVIQEILAFMKIFLKHSKIYLKYSCEKGNLGSSIRGLIIRFSFSYDKYG